MKMTNALMDGYTMPFEGEKHNLTIMMLPYRKDTWTNGGRDAREIFKEIIYNIARFEKVLVVSDSSIYDDVKNDYLDKDNIKIIKIDYNDAWARDIAPIFLRKDNKLRAVDFGFNAWGGSVDGLYEDYHLDNLFREKIANHLKVNFYKFKDFILEGGSIHSDGNYTLLVTETCLLSKGRNPKYNKAEIEQILKETLGMKQVIWLPHGIYNDETNEHIDNVACFLDPYTIGIAESKVNDIQKEWLEECYKILESKTNIDGIPYKIVKIPLPNPPLYITDEEASLICHNPAYDRLTGMQMAASYINFYQGEKYIILPQFGVREDEEAYNILKEFYQNKEIIKINSRNILISGGNIHCITMQVCKGEYDYD